MQIIPANAYSIEDAVNDYFHGTYTASEERIRKGFDANATIVGFFNGEYVEWTVDQFVERVLSGPIQQESGDTFDKKIIAIEQSDFIATVTARTKVFDHYFIDHLSLIKLEKGWKIRHKQFTNTAEQKGDDTSIKNSESRS